jgi:hypothetical protein
VAAVVAPAVTVAQTAPAAGVLAATTPVVASPAAAVPVAAAAIPVAAAMPAGEMVGARAATPQTKSTEPVAAAAALQAVQLLRTQRVPAGIGVAVLFVAVFALILGNPFQTGGAQGVLDATDTPSAPSFGIALEPTASETPDVGGGSAAPATHEPTGTDSTGKPAGAPRVTTRPAATPTLQPGATPVPLGATPTPTTTPPPTPTPPQSTPPPTPTPDPTPTPAPTPPPTPTPAPTPTPTPACQTVPNMVGLTVAKARNAWNGAGFTGGFSAPPGPAKAIVTSQSQPAGACLPLDTGITVTT